MRDLILRAMQLRSNQSREPLATRTIRNAVREVSVLSSPDGPEFAEAIDRMIEEGIVEPKADGYALTEAGLRVKA